jgi:hypothetical protein
MKARISIVILVASFLTTICANGDSALTVVTLGANTSPFTESALPFDDGVCLQAHSRNGADSLACRSACEMRGLRNTCSDDMSWHELVDSVSNIWWAKWSVDLALQVASKAKVGELTLSQHLARNGLNFPSGIWDKTSAILNPAICATMILETASQVGKLNSGKTCSRGRSMAPPTPVEANCQLVYAVSACADTFASYSPSAYGAYVSSGAAAAVTTAMTTCSVGLLAAHHIRKVTAESDCMNTIAASAGIQFEKSEDGSIVPQNCCVCDQETYEDSWIPGGDNIIASKKWTAPASSYAFDPMCEGREGATFNSVIADHQGRWTQTTYSNCRRAKPVKGQCSLAR